MKERNEEIKEGSNDGGIVNQEERERKREKT